MPDSLWDGNTYFYDIHEVFETGFVSAKGIGIIKWIQFIDNNTSIKISRFYIL